MVGMLEMQVHSAPGCSHSHRRAVGKAVVDQAFPFQLPLHMPAQHFHPLLFSSAQCPSLALRASYLHESFHSASQMSRTGAAGCCISSGWEWAGNPDWSAWECSL